MKKTVILTAFGSTGPAVSTYRHIEQCLQPRLPDCTFYWSYSSRVVAKQLQGEGRSGVKTVSRILAELEAAGHKEAVVQSLHLFPGHEFHKIGREAGRADMACRLGLPLLSSFKDYQIMAYLLKDLILSHSESAILIVGHGTDHPSWTSYPALEAMLRREYGANIFVGVVEKSPDSSHIPAEIVAGGYSHVFMIPFFLMAGLHYRRDMIGEEASWQRRLVDVGLAVDSYAHGLGLLPGISMLIQSHIEAAQAT
ncbi:sirohydrochlorin cobaltochelatase [Desulfotalea psychrophila]|uniref:Related to cobalt chelatase n=1 Tax=Desulfotalea psychrophila (strain LSv54 / DSM 12343) TaxID=177439 RepID=Q6AQQ2_DESPS|nr:sirohydrochlorin cobaltochelatase [Desulfotalea psychrophila]CAG35321.1 related to cobalt chelatase [Desulfotalea psychrophila LSv54]